MNLSAYHITLKTHTEKSNWIRVHNQAANQPLAIASKMDRQTKYLDLRRRTVSQNLYKNAANKIFILFLFSFRKQTDTHSPIHMHTKNYL